MEENGKDPQSLSTAPQEGAPSSDKATNSGSDRRIQEITMALSPDISETSDQEMVARRPINITNCPGALVGRNVQKNIHYHAPLPSPIEAMIERTKQSIQNFDERTHFVTRPSKRALDIVKKKGKVVVTAKPKQGKTAMARYISKILTADKKFTPVEMISPDQWTELVPDKYYLVIVDVFGRNTDNFQSQWSQVLRQINDQVECGKIILVMTCDNVIAKNLGRLFDKSCIIDLQTDEHKLRRFEKVEILDRLLRKHGMILPKMAVFDACSEGPADDFLECCDFFNRNLGLDFFRDPHEMVSLKMSELFESHKTKYCAMVTDALRLCCGMKDYQNLKSEIENLCCIEKASLGESPFETGDFSKHKTYYKCAFLSMKNLDLSCMVRICPFDILAEHTTTKSAQQNNKLHLPVGVHEILASRIKENFGINVTQTLRHDCFSDRRFLNAVDPELFVMMSENATEVMNLAIEYQHTELVETLHGLTLIKLSEDSKHELLHKAFDTMNTDVIALLMDDSSEQICQICVHNICSSLGKVAPGSLPRSYFRLLSSFSFGDLKPYIKNLIKSEHTDIITNLLLQQTADYHAIRNYVLFCCCKYGRRDIYLSTKEMDFALPDPDDLLSHAVEGGNIDIVKDILSMGANPNINSHGTYKPIHLACRFNHIPVMEELLRNGADIMALSTSKETVLHVASNVTSGTQPETLRWLLREHLGMLNLEAATDDGWTALHYASSAGNIGTARLLLSYRPNVLCCDNDGNTPLHCQVSGENPSTEVIELLISAGSAPDCKNTRGETPLQLIAKRLVPQRCIVLQYLAAKEPKQVNVKDEEGNSIFHSLLGTDCCVEEAEVLLEAGADINLPDMNGDTPFHLLAMKKFPDTIAAIVDKRTTESQHARNRDQQTPLHNAVSVAQNMETVERLVEAYPEFVLAADSNGNTPVHIICEECPENGDQYLDLMHNPHAWKARNEQDLTPLHLAAGSPGDASPAIVGMLLRHQADVAACDRNGNTPLHMASLLSGNHSALIIQMLIDKGGTFGLNKHGNSPLHMVCQSKGESKAQVAFLLIDNGSMIETLNTDGRTPIEIAISRNEMEMAETLMNLLIRQVCTSKSYKGDGVIRVWKYMKSVNHSHAKRLLHSVCEIPEVSTSKLIRGLADAGCSVNAKDDTGKSPLHVACLHAGKYSVDIVEELVSLGAKIHDKDVNGRNALHFACMSQNERAIRTLQFLIEKDVQLNEPDGDGNTPLHKAIETAGNHCYDAVMTLINAGACTDVQNWFQQTPYDLVPHSNAKICQLLVGDKLWHRCNGDRKLQEQTVRSLIERGASVNYRHKTGKTLLHKLALEGGKHALENTKLLLSFDADPHATFENLTPYDTAIFSENYELLNVLENKMKTSKPRPSKTEKPKDDYTIEDVLHHVEGIYEGTATAMKKAVDHVEPGNEMVSGVMQGTAQTLQIGTKMVKGLSKGLEFFKSLGDDL
ncbi:rabankyrin-5-like isoform X2 [Haliotis rubra]|uniref:rabankyrin-5-like isoform X2 n=1 Tax=Haliotis rubra TaxID=36100 RepID=UPI001EE55845|nr:rabankyrin-5-like isoform X2 [Haliotis rubra]